MVNSKSEQRGKEPWTKLIEVYFTYEKPETRLLYI